MTAEQERARLRRNRYRTPIAVVDEAAERERYDKTRSQFLHLEWNPPADKPSQESKIR